MSAKVGIGVATGNDRVFITKDPELVEPSRLLKLALAADILEGAMKWSGHYLVDPWNGDGLVRLENFQSCGRTLSGTKKRSRNAIPLQTMFGDGIRRSTASRMSLRVHRSFILQTSRMCSILYWTLARPIHTTIYTSFNPMNGTLRC
jgi:hypothetical protein